MKALSHQIFEVPGHLLTCLYSWTCGWSSSQLWHLTWHLFHRLFQHRWWKLFSPLSLCTRLKVSGHQESSRGGGREGLWACGGTGVNCRHLSTRLLCNTWLPSGQGGCCVLSPFFSSQCQSTRACCVLVGAGGSRASARRHN